MTNSLKLYSKRRKYEYINRVFYSVYIILAKKIKTMEKILMIYFIFYLNCLNNKENLLKLLIYKKKKYNFL